MNTINLHGTMYNIRCSHFIGNTQYDRAELIVKNSNQAESVIHLKFKHSSNNHVDGDEVSIKGNIRSYSYTENGKNRVEIYVFTYFEPAETEENYTEIDGRICKMSPIRHLSNGSQNIQFILANNIIYESAKLNSYIPCIAWNDVAKVISSLSVGTRLKLLGELRSREYIKHDQESDENKFMLAHEFLITSFELIEDNSEG